MSPLGFALVAAGLVGLVLWFDIRATGQVAEQFGEDPRHWQAMMLPFGIFGPLVAYAILTRRGGGGPSGYA